MRWIVAALLAAHGLIHLMGFAKAFGYAELPQLTQPVSHVIAVAWLAAGLVRVSRSATKNRRRRPSVRTRNYRVELLLLPMHRNNGHSGTELRARIRAGTSRRPTISLVTVAFRNGSIPHRAEFCTESDGTNLAIAGASIFDI
jgi:hypothetical protein